MKILGIDCAGIITNIGAAINGQVVSQKSAELGRRQTELLPLMTESVLKEARLALSDLDLIAVSTGPGRYTGIRAGIAYGAALAEALNIFVVPLSSLEILIYGLSDKFKILAPVVAAKRGYCYAAVYGERGKILEAPAFMSNDAFAETLKKYKDAAVVTSDAKQTENLRESGRRITAPQSGAGGACAVMGEERAARALPPREIRGTYLREPDVGSV